MELTPRAFQRMFPNASKSTFAANFGEHVDPEAHAPRLPDSEPQRDDPKALVGLPQGEAACTQRARVCIKRFGLRALDRENLWGGTKAIVDCLKEAGLIVDDSEEWIDLEVRQERVHDRDQRRTEITITWLE